MREAFGLKARVWESLYSVHQFASWALYPAACLLGGLLIRAVLVAAFGFRPLRPAVLIVVITALAIVAVCRLATAWFSISLRYALLWMAKHWARFCLAALALVIAVCLAFDPQASAATVKRLWPVVSVSHIFETAAIVALIFIFAWVLRARSIMYISAFEDYTGNDSLKPYVQGAAPLLGNELGRIRHLYETANGSGDTPTIGKGRSGDSPRATINVENVGESLSSIATASSKVKVGPLEIPIGATLGLLAKMARGPRLSGSIHKRGDSLAIIATLEGGQFRGLDWHVTTDDLQMCDLEHKSFPFDRMIEQLAYRVFTDVGNVGSPSWKAVHFFTDGLQCLRVTNRTEVDKPSNFRSAERSFIRALAQDSKFWRCRYSLGVTYQNLKQKESARVAFRKSLEDNPAFADGYYALALDIWDGAPKGANVTPKPSCAQIINLCERAVALNANHARAWTMMGIARRRSDAPDISAPQANFRPAVRDLEIAAAVAWRNFCRLTFSRKRFENAWADAELCLRNLAIVHAYVANRSGASWHRSIAAFRQALYAARGNPDTWFELGKTLLDSTPAGFLGGRRAARKRHCAALGAFTAAVQSHPKPTYWAYIARAQAAIFSETNRNSKEKEAAKIAVAEACRVARDTLYLEEDLRRTLRTACEATDQVQLANEIDAVAMLRNEADAIAKAVGKSDPQYVARIGQLQQPDSTPWVRSQSDVLIADAWVDVAFAESNKTAASATAVKAQDLYRSIIAVLEPEHKRELTERSLYTQLSRAFQAQANAASASSRAEIWAEALYQAERGVNQNPFGAWERSMLAYVYSELQDFERSNIEWNTALDLDPDNLDTVYNIAQTYTALVDGLRDPEKRTELLTQKVELLERSLRVAESQSLTEETRARSMEAIAQLRYNLGLAYIDKLDYDRGISHLKRARALNFKPLELTWLLGWYHKENKLYNEAGSYFDEGIQLAAADPDKCRDMPLFELLARLDLGRAYAYADRGVRLSEAQQIIEAARERWRDVSKNGGSNAEASRKILESGYYELNGWIALRSERVAEAISELEKALDLGADADAYYRLALAYCMQAERSETGRKQCLARAQDICKMTTLCDTRGFYKADLEEVRLRIEALAKSEPAASLHLVRAQ